MFNLFVFSSQHLVSTAFVKKKKKKLAYSPPNSSTQADKAKKKKESLTQEKHCNYLGQKKSTEAESAANNDWRL